MGSSWVIKTRKQAKRDGDSHYFTGIPCPNGHVDLRRVSSYCCVSCSREWMAKQRAENPEFLERQRSISRAVASRHYRTNACYRDRVNAAAREAWANRFKTEKGREQAKRWTKKWRDKNPDKVRDARKAYREKNKDRFAFVDSLRACIKRLKKIKKENYTIQALGYSRSDFISHIESLFKPGMTWENHGEWHIDHIKPLFSFIKEGNFNISEAHALSNLRPLWKAENLSKGKKEDPEGSSLIWL